MRKWVENQREAEERTQEKTGAHGFSRAGTPSYRSQQLSSFAQVGYICVSITYTRKHSDSGRVLEEQEMGKETRQT